MNLRALNHGFDRTLYPNHVVLGLGGTFRMHGANGTDGTVVVWRFSDAPAWSHNPIRNMGQGDIIYAFPIGSETARNNRQNVEFYNPNVRNDTRWRPAGGQFVPPPAHLDEDDDEEEEEEEDDEDAPDEYDQAVALAAVGDRDPLGNVLTLNMINASRGFMGMPLIENPPPAPPLPVAPAVNPTLEPQPPAGTSFVAPEGQAKLFCLTFNGVPVASLEEFDKVASPLLETTPSTAIHQLWAAQWNESPDAVLDRIMDAEPILTACTGYVRVPQAMGVVAIQEPTVQEMVAQPVSGLIIRAAAGALLSGGMSNHFSFSDTGSLVINPENPPSLDQGYEMMARVFSVEETGDRLRNFSRWNQGALIAEFQRFYGDAFILDQLCESTERSYNTLNACLNTHLRWGHRKRESLSWTHHKEVEFSTLTEDQKEWVLDQSVRLSLTVSDQRKVQSFVIRYGIDTFVEDMPEDRASMLERLEVRSVNRNFMFMLQGLWYSYRGPFEHIPNGAAQILNADTRQVLDREGHATSPREWVPVGVEVPFIRGHGATNQTGIEEARVTGEAPRRGHGGNTHLALGGTGPDISPADALMAATAADAVLEEATQDRIAEEQAREVPPAPPMIEVTITAPATEGDIYDPRPVEEPNPRLIPTPPAPHGGSVPEDASTYQFVYPDFWNEPGANLLMGMTGYPQGMPEELEALLDEARHEEFLNQNGDRPRTRRAFTAFLEASDDHLVPF